MIYLGLLGMALKESLLDVFQKTQKFRLLDAIPYSLFYEDKGKKTAYFHREVDRSQAVFP